MIVALRAMIVASMLVSRGSGFFVRIRADRRRSRTTTAEHRLWPVQYQAGHHAERDPERSRDHRDPREEVARLAAERTLTTHAAQGTSQSTAASTLYQDE